MKPIVSVIGILLIVFGIVFLGYQGITYTKKEKIAQIGDLQVTADTQKTIYISPIAGGAAVLVGLVLVVFGRNRQ